jgi:predicted GIY-YIG superfamily endonuclease
MPYVVYVLECRHGKYYVGRCAADQARARLLEHRSGQGSCAWTRAHPGLRYMSLKQSFDPLDEDRAVLEWMRTHGIPNVRGGTFSAVRLPREQVVCIGQMLRVKI